MDTRAPRITDSFSSRLLRHALSYPARREANGFLLARSPRGPARGCRGGCSPVDSEDVKKILELLVCFLHPVAVILVWIDLATRRNISTLAKVAWAVFALIPLVPFLYVLTGGDLW